MIKIRAKPGDMLVLLLYDLLGFGGWRPKKESYGDHRMQCRAVGIFKQLNKESVTLHGLEMMDDDDVKRKEVCDINDARMYPLGIIKKYKNLGRVLDWPKLEA